MLDIGDTAVEVLVQVLHLVGEMRIEVVDLVLEILVRGQDLINLLDIMQQDLDGLVRGMQAGLGVFRELANLVSDDGEAAASLASAGGFDCCVEGQQVRLSRNLVDHLHDIVDFLRALRQHVEFRHDLVRALHELVEQRALLVDALGQLMDGLLDELDIARHGRDRLDDARHLRLIILEYREQVVLELVDVILAGDDAAEEERVAVRIVLCEIIDIACGAW